MVLAPATRQNGNSVLPLQLSCCLGLLLFVIAFTIVIALIPIYLPHRNGGQVQSIQSPPRQVIYSIPSGTIYSTGSLTEAQLAYLVAYYQVIINNNPTTVGSTISSSGATVTSSTTKKRKRRATGIVQFLTFIYQILFRPGATLHQRNEIIAMIGEIIDVPIANFDLLLNSASSNQGTVTTTAATISTTSTLSAVNSTSSNQTTVTTTAATSSTTSRLSAAVVTGYTPIDTACPNSPFVVSSAALYPDEASWLQQRVPIAEVSLRAWLAGIGLNANDYNASTVLPRIALATSGGGLRSLLTGAGVIQAFDGHEQTVRTLFSGLLQGITYQTGTSGGAWLLSSFAVNNYPTISSLRDSLWIQRFQYFAGSNPVEPNYNMIVAAEIVGKKEAGFKVTSADVWGRYLAFELLQSPNGGPNVTFDQITSTDAFKSFSLPFPIVTALQLDSGMCIPARNASLYEFTPYAFGSWDVGIRAFTPIKFIGTTYNNNQEPANGQCVIGYDNAGFVLGTSSYLFNGLECILLPNGSIALYTNFPNTTFYDIIIGMNNIIQGIINPQAALTTDDVIFATYPNPFQGSVQAPKVSSLSELNFVDGGETYHNLPLWPLIQPVRKVDLIFANDNSADTTKNFPDGTQLLSTYMQAQLVGLPFPFIPNVNTFVSQGLNIRPTFFGCNETNVPLVIYLPNTNISFASGVSTYQFVFSEAQTLGLIQNGLNVATRSNSTQWAQCVACAIARRIGGLYGISTSAVCRSCFDTYCFKPS